MNRTRKNVVSQSPDPELLTRLQGLEARVSDVEDDVDELFDSECEDDLEDEDTVQ